MSLIPIKDQEKQEPMVISFVSEKVDIPINSLEALYYQRYDETTIPKSRQPFDVWQVKLKKDIHGAELMFVRIFSDGQMTLEFNSNESNLKKRYDNKMDIEIEVDLDL